MVVLNGKETSTPIPHIVVVVGDTPPPSTLGITSVQRQNEEIVPMKDMKMGFIPFKSKDPNLKNMDAQILTCNARRTRLSKMGEEDRIKYDYCLPYIFIPDKQEEVEKNTEVLVQLTIGGRGLSLNFDFEMDELEEFVEETAKDYSLSDEHKAVVEKAIKDEVKVAKEKIKKEKEARKAKIESFTKEERENLKNLKFFKFYPQNKEDIDISNLRSPFINRYYGKATKVF